MKQAGPAGPNRNLPRLWLRALLSRFFPGQQVADEPAWIWLWAGFEAVLFGVAALTLAFWLNPVDPFGTSAEFPWLWLVPAVVAMRYGSVIGLVSVLTYFGGWIALEILRFVTPVFPQVYFLGGLILALICGQFADVWNSRQRRLRAVNAYLDERLNALTKSHFLLRLSHERLEQDLLAKPLTLRETLVRLRSLSSLDRQEALPGASEFCSCWRRAASLRWPPSSPCVATAPMIRRRQPSWGRRGRSTWPTRCSTTGLSRAIWCMCRWPSPARASSITAVT